MRNVTIVQRRLTHYRIPFFEKLRASLEAKNIQLTLIVGQPTDEELLKRDSGHLDWAISVKNYYLLNNRLCWTPYFKYVRDTDLLIITQENWQIAHQWALFKDNSFKVAFWGHGANLQRHGKRNWRDRYKDWTTTRADWWFAYTSLSKQLVAKTGFSEDKITVVNNTIDEAGICESLASVTTENIERVKAELGIKNSRVALFLGSLHESKNLPFLYSAAKRIKQEIADFNLLIIGDGPEREFVRKITKSEPWIKWVGALHGRDKVLCSLAADFIMNPGMVGLGIIDSFVFGLPMITTESPYHSPEISYLNPGTNGLITQPDINAYSKACIELIHDPIALIRLKKECRTSSRQYTLNNMVSNFTDGIERSLVSNMS